MDELRNESQVGCYIGSRFYGALCYADDLTLVCPSSRATDITLYIYEEFAHEHGLKLNSTKSVLATYNVDTNAVHTRNGIPIVKADQTSYFGHIIGNNSDYRNISQGVCNLITSTNTILSTFNFCS